MFERGTVVQIVDESHAWYPSLVVVDEPKSWGLQGYVITPRSNDGSESTACAYTRLKTNQVEEIGRAAVIVEE